MILLYLCAGCIFTKDRPQNPFKDTNQYISFYFVGFC